MTDEQAFEKYYGRKPNSKPWNNKDDKRWHGFLAGRKSKEQEWKGLSAFQAGAAFQLEIDSEKIGELKDKVNRAVSALERTSDSYDDSLDEIEKLEAQLERYKKAFIEVGRIKELICFSARDWSLDSLDRYIYGVLVGWDDSSIHEFRRKRYMNSKDASEIMDRAEIIKEAGE